MLSSFAIACAYNVITHEKVSRWISSITSWYQLGIQMGVPSHKLKKIELDYPNDVDRRKHEVVSHWMCNDAEASLSSLADILEECEQKVLAEKLRKECNDSYVKGKFIMVQHSVSSYSIHTTDVKNTIMLKIVNACLSYPIN